MVLFLVFDHHPVTSRFCLSSWRGDSLAINPTHWGCFSFARLVFLSQMVLKRWCVKHPADRCSMIRRRLHPEKPRASKGVPVQGPDAKAGGDKLFTRLVYFKFVILCLCDFCLSWVLGVLYFHMPRPEASTGGLKAAVNGWMFPRMPWHRCLWAMRRRRRRPFRPLAAASTERSTLDADSHR